MSPLAVEIYQTEAPIAVREWGDERLTIVVQKLMATKGDMAPPTPAEVDLFAMRCKATGLDPFSGQIHAIYRKDKNSPLGRSLTFQTGIDGLWLIAARTGQLDGADPPEWLGADGDWYSAWPFETPPLAARFTVYRKGAERGFTGIANYREYVQTYDDRPQGLWSRMPANQLRKCAAAQALREAFANDLGDVYETAELEHADAVVPDDVRAERAAEADQRTAEWRISADDVESLTELAREAKLTRGEARGILEAIAGVANPAHVKRGDLAAVRAAFEARIRADEPPTSSPAVGTPEVVPADEPPAAEDVPVVADEPASGGDPPEPPARRRRTPKPKAEASGATPLPGQTRDLDDDPLPPADPAEPLDDVPDDFGAMQGPPPPMYGQGAP